MAETLSSADYIFKQSRLHPTTADYPKTELGTHLKTIASLISKEAGADFVKTSTGFAGGGATVHDVELMRKTVGPQMGVKASGGVRTYEDAASMIRAGATRIGASAGVKIIQGPSAQPSPANGAGSSSKSY